MDGAGRNAQNEAVIERLIACINDRDTAVLSELFAEDSVVDWPQWAERVVGGEARRATCRAGPPLPSITPRSLRSAGDLVIAEALLDHGGPVSRTIVVFELHDGLIARETAYWSAPFDPPARRSRPVRLASDPPG